MWPNRTAAGSSLCGVFSLIPLRLYPSRLLEMTSQKHPNAPAEDLLHASLA